MKEKVQVWMIRAARSAHDCERCNAFITKGMEYYARNQFGKYSFFCLPCGAKLSADAVVKVERAKEAHRAKKKRGHHDPLLGPGHVVHGLGRMGA